jgi:predicted CXXCH cytochrome family protein
MAAYPDAMARANIQCESCHGPGSEHLGLTSNSEISISISTDNCAWCHDSGTHHAFPEQWDHSGDDATVFDGRGYHGGHAIGAFAGYAGGRGSCAPCHSGAGYIQWNYDGRPVNDYGLPGTIDNPPAATTITCATCHDPHDGTNSHQLRYDDTQLGDGTPITFELYGTGSQCMECHRSRRYAFEYASDIGNASSHYGPHHGPQADMLIGANVPDYGIQFPTSPHQVCAPCHGTIGSSFKDKKYYINGNADLDGNGIAEGLQLEVHGIMELLHAELPQDANGNVTIIEDSTIILTPEIMRAGYVYFWIEEDRSFGIHNPAFTIGLLKAALEELGVILAVDYPESGVLQEYQLSQNYPNPFNPTTTIEYSLPEQSNVKIVIYDVLGNQLDVLFSGESSAGTHSITWNADSYASGIYFYRMYTNNFTQVKKMLLMK